MCPDEAPLRGKLSGVKVCFHHWPGRGWWKRIRGCARLFRHSRPHLIHTHDAKGHTMALLGLLLSGHRAPLIVARRVDFPIGGNAMSRWKYNHSRVRRIVCVSQAIADICRPMLKHPDQVLRVVHSGVDIERVSAENTGRLRKEWDISPDALLVGCVAALAPHKDHMTLLRALAALRPFEALPAFCVLLIGDGGEREKIEAEIARLDLASVVKLTGFYHNVHQVLGDLDIFVMSSKTEGLGTSIIDAMAAGLPVAATRAGGIPELVGHEKSGLLAPVGRPVALAAALRRLLIDPALRKKMSVAARHRAQDFTCGEMVRKTIGIYDQVWHENG